MIQIQVHIDKLEGHDFINLCTFYWHCFQCCKRVGKYCAIVGMNKFAFDSPTSKKLPLLKRLWTCFRTRSFPAHSSSTQLFCLQKAEKFSFPHTHGPQIAPTDLRRYGKSNNVVWEPQEWQTFLSFLNLIMAKMILCTESSPWIVLLVLNTFSFSHL